MKVTIILCCVFALAACGKVKKSNFMGNFVDIVKGYGYPVETYEVQTEDGYILDLFRVSLDLNTSKEKRSGSEYQSSTPTSQQQKKVVFLMHGLMTNSESFIRGGPTESIGLNLADVGYDVFFGNARGTTYGQKHTTLDPNRDAAFWRFCWSEIGTKDLPALINKALSVSGEEKLSYIGHNEGTTSFYVLASEKPELQNKIERHLSLGPIVFMKNSTNEVLQNIEMHVKQRSWLIKNLGVNTFTPTNELLQDADSNCMEKINDESICKNVYFLINGYNSNHLNKTTLNQFLSRVPSTVSVREILHFVQLKSTGRFESYSEESSGKQYDLSKVTVPVALLHTPNDKLSTVSDVEALAKELPNVYWKTNMENLDNNLDLLYSENMYKVNAKVFEALQKNIQRYSEKKSWD